VTVNPALPLLPSLDAVIVAVPAATPEIAPVAETIATAVFELCHATLRPDRLFPPASLRIAFACAVWPATMEVGLSETVTLAIGIGGKGRTLIGD
jgi:hypothetical protein